MLWQPVASYHTVNSTDVFTVHDLDNAVTVHKPDLKGMEDAERTTRLI